MPQPPSPSIEGEIEFLSYFDSGDGKVVQKRVIGGKEYYSRMTYDRFLSSLVRAMEFLKNRG